MVVSTVPLQQLEYAIRQSITVREDQEEPALSAHLTTAVALGVNIDSADGELSKGDLLNRVQTSLRSRA